MCGAVGGVWGSREGCAVVLWGLMRIVLDQKGLDASEQKYNLYIAN